MVGAPQPEFILKTPQTAGAQAAPDPSPANTTGPAEAALHESDERFRNLLRDVPSIAVQGYGMDGITTYWNHASEELYGYTAEEAIGRSLLDLIIPGEMRDGVAGAMRQMAATGQPIPAAELALRRKDGSRVPVFSSHVIVKTPGRPAELFCLDIDLTERKQAEEALRESEASLREAQIIAGLGSYVLDIATGFWRSSAVLDEVFGIDRAFVRSVEGWASIIHPDDRTMMADYFRDEVVGRRRPFDKEYRIVRRDNQAERWVHGLGHLDFDTQGHPAKMHGTIQDITARKHAEADRQQFERRLQDTQKLESLGVLAGGIAHDFNNILTGILGNATLASLDLPAGSPVHDNVEAIKQGSLRAAELCKQMLAYSGKGSFVVQKLSLNRLVEDTTHLLRLSICKQAVLRFNLHPGLPAIEADATQIRQVIMNLVINASEAIAEKSGVISLSTGLSRVGRDQLDGTLLAPELPAGTYVHLEVADSGCGMSPATQARIFDPFFTTKFTGRGLGLAAVLGIVRGHKGALRLQSEPGRGTTFKLLFPCAAGPVEPAEPDRPAQTAWQGRGCVLVVDDEESVRSTAALMLRRLGFEVALTADGRQAVEVFRAEPDRFTLVLMDLTMPHLNGEEAINELWQIRPDVRVVLMSGFNEQEINSRLASRGPVGFLQKPFEYESLGQTVQQALAGGA